LRKGTYNGKVIINHNGYLHDILIFIIVIWWFTSL